MEMMKKVLILMITAALLAGCNSKTEKKDAPATDQEALAAEWVEVTLNVEGMTCDGCENAIKAGLESLEGIATVESSHEEAWTKVKYDKNLTSVEDIEAKITDTGYEVKGEL
jgi:copper chaperone